jgi:hypothetical protein
LKFQDLESKGDDFEDIQNAGVMVSLELWGDTSLRLWILSRPRFNYTWGVKLENRLAPVLGADAHSIKAWPDPGGLWPHLGSGLQPSDFRGAAYLGLRPRLVYGALSALGTVA